MSKLDLVVELVKSLNQGNSGNADERVEMALYQYNQIEKEGLILTISTAESVKKTKHEPTSTLHEKY